MKLIGSGNLDSIGYVTHKLENLVLIDSDVTDFSIVVYLCWMQRHVALPNLFGLTSLVLLVSTNPNSIFLK